MYLFVLMIYISFDYLSLKERERVDSLHSTKKTKLFRNVPMNVES